jgi:C4-dicarboxylate transporter, DctM subunit
MVSPAAKQWPRPREIEESAVVTMMIESGMLTPPVGMNVFTLKTMVPSIPLPTIFRGVMPFLVANLLAIAALIAWPGLALAPLSWF